MNKSIGPPTVDAFSKANTSKAVLSETIQHPLTLFPTAAGLLGGLALALFGTSPLLAAITIGGTTIGVGSWVVNYFGRGSTFAKKYHDLLHQQFEDYSSQNLHELEGDLTNMDCQQGAEQLTSFQDKFTNLKKVLRMKLSEGELTYSRYVGIAEQVYLSAIENLKQVQAILTHLSDIDSDELNKHVSRLEKNRTKTEADLAEIETLKTRLQLFQDENSKVKNLLVQNEQALTTLDQTAAAVATIASSQGSSQVAMDDAMGELKNMAQRASQYRSTNNR